MRSSQWSALGTGSMILSIVLFTMSNMYSCSDLNLGYCVARYAFASPAIILFFLAWVFWICGGLEPDAGKR